MADQVRGPGHRRCRGDREGSWSQAVPTARSDRRGPPSDAQRTPCRHLDSLVDSLDGRPGRDREGRRGEDLADHNLKPWRVETFKVSNDPHFEEKLVDVVGLYLNPPSRAVVFSYDEKTQCQALDRTQPSLPMKPGRAGTMTHDYKRNGTIDLFAAMNIATGEVLTGLNKGHAGADVLKFFKQIDASVPRGLAVRVGLPQRNRCNCCLPHKWALSCRSFGIGSEARRWQCEP